MNQETIDLLTNIKNDMMKLCEDDENKREDIHRYFTKLIDDN
jgi:hypothetical protein